MLQKKKKPILNQFRFFSFRSLKSSTTWSLLTSRVLVVNHCLLAAKVVECTQRYTTCEEKWLNVLKYAHGVWLRAYLSTLLLRPALHLQNGLSLQQAHKTFFPHWLYFSESERHGWTPWYPVHVAVFTRACKPALCVMVNICIFSSSHSRIYWLTQTLSNKGLGFYAPQLFFLPINSLAKSLNVHAMLSELVRIFNISLLLAPLCLALQSRIIYFISFESIWICSATASSWHCFAWYKHVA